MTRWVAGTSTLVLSLGLALGLPATPAGAAGAATSAAAAKHPVSTIVFADQGSGLWRVSTTGTGLTRLTSDPDVSHPSLSPDGGTVAYASGGQIWVINGTGDPQQLTSLPAGAGAGEPTWSPNGAKIAFTQRAGSFQDVYAISPAGGAVTRVTWASSVGCSAADPAWSPDSSTLAYQRIQGMTGTCATSGIVTQKIGQKPKVFPAGPTAQQPSFTADGAHLIYLAACDDDILCGDNTVGYEATLAFGNVHIVSDEFTCHGDFCLESIVASPAGGWVELGEFTEDDSPNAQHESCWQGAKDGANQTKLYTAPAFCLNNLYGADFAIH
jgi:WD40-like Beta Propeller Repeat